MFLGHYFTVRAIVPHNRQTKPANGVSTHCRGGMLPPECIHKYTFRRVIGRIQCAPTVDGNVIHFHSVLNHFLGADYADYADFFAYNVIENSLLSAKSA